MLEIAKHVLDVTENSIRAGADIIEIDITENTAKDLLSVEIRDNGGGMTEDVAKTATDPFFTTKDCKSVGLGIALLKQAVEASGGSFILESQKDRGTKLCACFKHSHIDRQPLGDMSGVITAVIASNPEVDIVYTHSKNSGSFTWNSSCLRKDIEDIALNNAKVLAFIKQSINDELKNLK